MKPIRKTLPVLKTLPPDLKKAENGLWAYATVERPDEEHDIVRVSGLSLERAKKSPIPIIVNHRLKPFENGEPTVVGRIEEFAQTTHKADDGSTAPALAFRMSWAPSELATKWKTLYDAGYIEGFSIGATISEAKPIRGGGVDITKASLYEVSVCTLPMNADATKLAAMKDVLGDDFPDDEDGGNDAMNGLIAALQKNTEAIAQSNESLLKQITRLSDDVECLVAARSEEAEQTVSRTTPQAIPFDEQVILRALKRILSD